ncbi:hypothetical protein Tco_1373007, partial [Tanacetum coccineum]
DYVAKPLYSRFKNADDFKGLPPPFSGDYTPKPHEEFDDSLYDYVYKGTQKPETSVSDDKTIEYSTCQSNDSEGSIGNTSEQSADLESESANVSKQESGPKPNKTNETVVPTLKPKAEAELKKQRVVNTGPRVQKPVWTNANRINHANQFVTRSVILNSARSNVNSVRPNLNTGRTNVNSVRQNVNSVRQNVNSVRHNVNSVRQNVNSVRQNVNSVRQNVNSVGPKVNTGSRYINSVHPKPTSISPRFSPNRSQVNNSNQKGNFSKFYSPVRRPIQNKAVSNNMIWKPKTNISNSNHVNSARKQAVGQSVKGNKGNAVKSSACWTWDYKRNEFTYQSKNNSGSCSYKTFEFIDPQGRPKSEMAWVPKRN